MAEFVQQSIEEMLPELQQMERVGLFTKDENRQILKRRKAYEYKLRRRTKCKEDFLQYIQYEINTLGLIRLRREKTGYTFKKLEIDIAVVQRIHRLFKLATVRFQDDVKLWLSHIEFCKQRREKATVSRLFTNMLQVHNKKQDLWTLAAQWEFEYNANPENARSLLQRGLRFNPESRELWLEYYRMELLYSEKMRKRRVILGGPLPEGETEAPDAVLEGAVAQVVYTQAMQTIPGDVSFMLSFIPIVRLFDFTQTHEDKIFEDLQSLFPACEQTWDALARRCLHPSRESRNAKKRKREKLAWLAEAEINCDQVFREAVHKLPTELMWTKRLEYCLEQIEKKRKSNHPDQQKENKILSALEVFKCASSAKLLSENLYEQWLELLMSVGEVDQARDVGTEATSRYPTSVSLWRQRLLSLTCSLEDQSNVLEVLQQARSALSERECWPPWEIVLEYLISNNSAQVEKYLQVSSSLPTREVCVPAKQLCLEWTALTQGVAKARHVYSRLIRVKPVSLEFFRRFLSIENAQANPKMKRLRDVFEDAVREYGASDTDLWLEYIRLEMNHPKGNSVNAGKLHYRAMKYLEGSLIERFVTQYTLLQTGHDV